MGIVLKIAFRYLKAKKTHSAVNIISVISVCGVALATVALVCVLSVFNGFSSLMGEKLAKLDPQISIAPVQGKVIGNADSLLNIINHIDGVEVAQPTIEDQALAIFGNRQMPVQVKGVTKDYDKITDIKDIIIDGEYSLEDSTFNHAILSIGVAANLRTASGYYDMLKIYAPRRNSRMNLANPSSSFRTDSLFISSVYQVDQNSYDRDIVYLPISVAKRLFDYDKQATRIEVKLAKNTDETAIINNIQNTIGKNYTVKNRLMQQDSIFKMVNIEKWVTFLLLAFILVIATFNVISTLSLLIIEKDESIRTFRNLGATNQQISRIFVTEGLLISFVGAIGGIIIGIALCLVQQEFGLIKLAGDADAVIIDNYPVKLIWSDIAIVFSLVAIVGLVTSVVTSVLMRSRLKS